MIVDEVGVVQAGIPRLSEIVKEERLQKRHHLLRSPLRVKGKEVSLNSSIGKYRL